MSNTNITADHFVQVYKGGVYTTHNSPDFKYMVKFRYYAKDGTKYGCVFYTPHLLDLERLIESASQLDEGIEYAVINQDEDSDQFSNWNRAVPVND